MRKIVLLFCFLIGFNANAEENEIDLENLTPAQAEAIRPEVCSRLLAASLNGIGIIFSAEDPSVAEIKERLSLAESFTNIYKNLCGGQ